MPFASFIRQSRNHFYYCWLHRWSKRRYKVGRGIDSPFGISLPTFNLHKRKKHAKSVPFGLGFHLDSKYCLKNKFIYQLVSFASQFNQSRGPMLIIQEQLLTQFDYLVGIENANISFDTQKQWATAGL